MTDPELERDSRTRLRRQSKRKTEQLTRDLKSYHFRGPLAEVVESFPLAPDHFQILAVLLHRHMRSEDPGLEGRLILGSLFENSYDVLARIDLLQSDSPVRASGLVALEDSDTNPEDLLEARFVLSEQALQGLRHEITGPVSIDRGTTRTTPYRSNREFLIDMRVLHNLYRQRSERVFNHDRWNRLHNSNHEPGRSLSERIGGTWERMRCRIELDPAAVSFPAVRFMREHALSEEEMVIVVHLLFKELFEGNAYVDVADLLKLVSRSETELIQNRSLVLPTSPLAKLDIISIEPMLEGRVLTGEAFLSDWVVNYLLGATTPEVTIKSDERIDFHKYLAQLDDSKGFFKDMEAN